MKERPILFSAPMVRAILAGQKTQTRRAVKPQPDHRTTRVSICRDQWMGNGPSGNGVGTAQWDPWRKSPFAAGDRLWVRETWAPVSMFGDAPLGKTFQSDWAYRASGDFIGCHRWRPSIHMPRAASRILLEIVSVRVERLQDISPDDCIAEGAWRAVDRALGRGHEAVAAYQYLWVHINGAGSWNANPWVWVIEFRRVVHNAEPMPR
ncbi:MAG: hypothetical protein HYZ18_14065 [Pseudogulbenkiania sp.]|nr:hypothetical protein [Pseudogulbenkiania sp.]